MFGDSAFLRLAAALAMAALASAPLSASDRISDFSLIDQNGKFFQLSRQANFDAIVLMAHEDSKNVRRAATELAELTAQFEDRNVGFYFIDSSGESDKAEIRKAAEDADIEVPVLLDETQLIARELGIERETDVVILDPSDLELVFRGALNDRWARGSRARRASDHFAADALNQFLAGKAITAKQTDSKGDFIALADIEERSYAKDIAPILKARCVSCHMEGGIAPFAMNSHQMIQGWSPMIREVLYTKRMPPGQIDNEYVHDFRDVSHITPEETIKLVSWIESGAKNTDGSDPLAEYSPEMAKWAYGEPDMIIPIPPQQIPATGVQDYRNIPVALDIEEDIWVKAVEFEAGDPTVLHHIIAFAYSPGGVNQFEILNQGIGLGAYAPGNEINTYPENSGFPLKVGGGLLLQLHYTTSGKETTDASEIALYLWDEKPERQVLGGSAADLDINIPPFAQRHEMVATAKFRKDSYITMLGPHMHYRGHDANFTLVYPDGSSEEVLNVPNYQFNWQKVYDFKDPKFVPAGTQMVFTGTFDNSEFNPSNPDASQTLSWGEQTWQEMFFGFYRYVEAGNPGAD